MTRAVFVAGTWQVLVAAASVAQDSAETGRSADDVLILYGSGFQAEFKKNLEQIARQARPWSRVVWADDVLLCHFPTTMFAPVAARILWDRVGKQVDEVWVTKLYDDAAKLVVNAYPDSRVVLYEDGAEEFIAQEMTCGPERLKRLRWDEWPGALRREWSHWIKAPECLELVGFCARHKKRVSRLFSVLIRYLDLPPHLEGIPVAEIESGRLLACLRTVSGSMGKPAETGGWPGGEDVILFLPQPYTESRSLQLEEEFFLYRDAIGDLLKKGYRVLWKEHPRQMASFWPRLSETVPSSRLTQMAAPTGVPVECLVEGRQLAGVVSVSSSALFYLKGLYGFMAYTLAGRVPRKKWKLPVDAQLAELFEKKLPGLEQLPEKI